MPTLVCHTPRRQLLYFVHRYTCGYDDIERASEIRFLGFDGSARSKRHSVLLLLVRSLAAAVAAAGSPWRQATLNCVLHVSTRRRVSSRSSTMRTASSSEIRGWRSRMPIDSALASDSSVVRLLTPRIAATRCRRPSATLHATPSTGASWWRSSERAATLSAASTSTCSTASGGATLARSLCCARHKAEVPNRGRESTCSACARLSDQSGDRLCVGWQVWARCCCSASRARRAPLAARTYRSRSSTIAPICCRTMANEASEVSGDHGHEAMAYCSRLTRLRLTCAEVGTAPCDAAHNCDESKVTRPSHFVVLRRDVRD